MRDAPFHIAARGLDVTIVPAPPSLMLRLWRPGDAVFQRLDAALGAPWPQEPNTTAEGAFDVLWLAPAEWLVMGKSTEAMAGGLARACGDAVHHIADVTASRTLLRVAGEAARDFLAKGCSLDLHPRAFGTTQCAQTLLAQVPVLMRRRIGMFEVHADVSVTHYLAAWLRDAAAEFGV